MKLSRFNFYAIALGLMSASFLYAASDSFDEAIVEPHQCYYWVGLHKSNLYEYEAEQLQSLIAELDQDVLAKNSERRRATLLLGARLNHVDVDSEILTAWMSNLTGTPERTTDEDNLIYEIAMTFGAQSLETELHHFLSSESLPVREATFSALLFYAGQSELSSMLERERKRAERLKVEAQKVVEAYKSDPVRGAELAKQLAEKSNFAPSAVGQLRDYFAYQGYEKSDEEWVRMIGKNGLLDMRSTATGRDMFRPAGGGYLEDSLTNKFLLQKLHEIFAKTLSKSERLALERLFRNASAESGIANNIYNTPLFYLLGFELTDEERAYLMKEAGLTEDQILPSGQMHLIGYELETSQTLTEISPVAPEAEEVAEVIEEVTEPEPAIEESEEVVIAEPIEEDIEQPSNWWLWLIGAVVVVGGIGLVLRRKS